MIISDLSYLEVVSDAPSIVGGATYNNRSVKRAKVRQDSTSTAVSLAAVNLPILSPGDSFAGAASSSENSSRISQ